MAVDIPATSDAIPGTLVLRDASGNFSGGSGGGSVTVSTNDRILGRVTAGSGAVEEITCTAAGRALLDDLDAAAQRTTLDAASSTHTHGAADIVSGTINTARLGSGTANNTTFLRGDNTWATPSGSGGGLGAMQVIALSTVLN